MSREVHVRFCERLGVQLPGPTHLIVLNETGLRRILKSYFDYYKFAPYCLTSLCL